MILGIGEDWQKLQSNPNVATPSISLVMCRFVGVTYTWQWIELATVLVLLRKWEGVLQYVIHLFSKGNIAFNVYLLLINCVAGQLECISS